MQLFTFSPSAADHLIPWNNDAVRKSQGIQIKLFRELLFRLARLRRANPGHYILLRGQPFDYRNRETNATEIRPGAFRASKDHRQLAERLRAGCRALSDSATGNQISQQGKTDLKNPLVAQIILQHYHSEAQIDTPWIDLTDAPQIAVYFATRNASQPMIYALAVPRRAVYFESIEQVTGTVCFALGTTCFADALRPHFQSAYSLASIQNYTDAESHSLAGFKEDLSEYLLCKFQVNQSTVLGEIQHSFGIPKGHGIYPRESDDPMVDICREVGSKLAPQ